MELEGEKKVIYRFRKDKFMNFICDISNNKGNELIFNKLIFNGVKEIFKFKSCHLLINNICYYKFYEPMYLSKNNIREIKITDNNYSMRYNIKTFIPKLKLNNFRNHKISLLVVNSGDLIDSIENIEIEVIYRGIDNIINEPDKLYELEYNYTYYKPVSMYNIDKYNNISFPLDIYYKVNGLFLINCNNNNKKIKYVSINSSHDNNFIFDFENKEVNNDNIIVINNGCIFLNLSNNVVTYDKIFNLADNNSFNPIKYKFNYINIKLTNRIKDIINLYYNYKMKMTVKNGENIDLYFDNGLKWNN